MLSKICKNWAPDKVSNMQLILKSLLLWLLFLASLFGFFFLFCPFVDRSKTKCIEWSASHKVRRKQERKIADNCHTNAEKIVLTSDSVYFIIESLVVERPASCNFWLDLITKQYISERIPCICILTYARCIPHLHWCSNKNAHAIEGLRGKRWTWKCSLLVMLFALRLLAHLYIPVSTKSYNLTPYYVPCSRNILWKIPLDVIISN